MARTGRRGPAAGAQGDRGKAALAQWLRERTTVSLRWVSERFGMGHYRQAGRRPRKMRATDLRKLQQVQAKLAAIAGVERGKHR